MEEVEHEPRSKKVGKCRSCGQTEIRLVRIFNGDSFYLPNERHRIVSHNITDQCQNIECWRYVHLSEVKSWIPKNLTV